jgi:plastocyanin
VGTRIIGLCALLVAAVALGPIPGTNADSVLLRSLIFDHSHTACASIDSAGNLTSTATQTGVAFDGSRLLVSCWNDNTIAAVSPSDGSQLAVYHITGGTDFGALAWDPTRNVLWACNQHETEVGRIDLSTSTYVPVFTARGCTDALAYDPSDDTLWAGRDGGHAVATLEHYSITGTLLGSKNIGNLVNDRSGVAFAGSRVFIASPHSGYPKHLWQTTRAFTSATILTTWTGVAKAEDLECDGETFSTPVIWVQWNHQNLLQAYPIGGTCGPPAGAELTVSQTPSTSAVADSPVTFTDTVTNLGPLDGVNAVASIPVPSRVVSGGATSSQGTCTGAATITCSLGTIPAGGSATISVTLTPIAPGSLANTISVTSDATLAAASDTTAVAVAAQPGTSYTWVTDSGFSPATTQTTLGGSVQWDFVGTAVHSVRDTSGLGTFDTGAVAPVAYASTRFTAAGNFKIGDAWSSATGVVAVPMSVPASASLATPITVAWASAPLPTGMVEDIQIRRPGQTTWKAFITGAVGQSATFSADAGAGKYQFRSRLRNPQAGASSTYTSARSVKFS